ncbi:argonaut-like protein [Tieghemostelium lacteum]|uniref:Argonaut-like protein n=1 Tax=Tieghemostelium lacteum TaxID=361077 RepID=A0A151Z6I6_TIELA|nr:argonaut-like protein [Tieghemostelium lacteum]|eukprot:KYQ89548.1 argonaut-like protein [Tieghemostelium lacteum]
MPPKPKGTLSKEIPKPVQGEQEPSGSPVPLPTAHVPKPKPKISEHKKQPKPKPTVSKSTVVVPTPVVPSAVVPSAVVPSAVVPSAVVPSAVVTTSIIPAVSPTMPPVKESKATTTTQLKKEYNKKKLPKVPTNPPSTTNTTTTTTTSSSKPPTKNQKKEKYNDKNKSNNPPLPTITSPLPTQTPTPIPTPTSAPTPTQSQTLAQLLQGMSITSSVPATVPVTSNVRQSNTTTTTTTTTSSSSRNNSNNNNTKSGPLTRNDNVMNLPEVSLWVNHFIVQLKNKTIYQYRVDFNPPIESKKIKRTYIDKFKSHIGDIDVYDGGEQLFTINDIPSTIFNIDEASTLEIRKVKQLTNQDFESYQFLNIVFKRCLRKLKLTRIGRQYYNPTQKIHHPAFQKSLVELWKGYNASINKTEVGTSLSIDTANKFIRTCTVLSEIQDLLANKFEKSDIDWSGKTVLTNYNKRYYRISGIAWNKNPTQPMSPPNTQTFAQYTYSQYNVKVTDPNQPLLIVQEKRAGVIETIYLIPEFCRSTGMTDEMRGNGDLMKALSKTNVNPEKKFQEINQFLATLETNKEVSNYLDSWGIKFDSALKVKGHLLPSPNVEFTNKPIGKLRWVLVCLPKEKDMLGEFIDIMVKTSGLLHPDIISPTGTSNNHYIDCITKHHKITQNKSPFYTIVIPKGFVGNFYNEIKQLTFLELGVISQCALFSNLTDSKKIRSIVKNLIYQIAGKLGGPPPWRLNNNVLQGFPRRVMQIGIDVGHNRDRQYKSVVGFVASLNDECTKFTNIAKLQEKPGKEIIHSLKPAMKKALEEYFKFNKFYPELVIVYRDGVGDGMLNQVKTLEVQAIKDAFIEMGSITNLQNCKLIYTVVKKNTNTRFLSSDQNELNPVPGTLITEGCTKGPNDFFLISHKALSRETTLNPTHYNIVYENAGIQMSDFQKFTYHQTFLYFNTTNSISVPAINTMPPKPKGPTHKTTIKGDQEQSGTPTQVPTPSEHKRPPKHFKPKALVPVVPTSTVPTVDTTLIPTTTTNTTTKTTTTTSPPQPTQTKPKKEYKKKEHKPKPSTTSPTPLPLSTDPMNTPTTTTTTTTTTSPSQPTQTKPKKEYKKKEYKPKPNVPVAKIATTITTPSSLPITQMMEGMSITSSIPVNVTVESTIKPTNTTTTTTTTTSSSSRNNSNNNNNTKPGPLTRNDNVMDFPPIDIQVNQFRAKFLSSSIYQYQVDFTPSVEAKRIKYSKMDKIKSHLPDIYLFDGGALLFTIVDFKTGTFSLNETDSISITKVKTFTSRDNEATQLLNILFKRCLRELKLTIIGRQYFNAAYKISDLDVFQRYKVELWPGYFTSINYIQTGTSLLCDTVHKLVRTCSVLDQIKEDLDRGYQRNDIDFTGSIVMTRYNNKTYRVSGIDWKKNPTQPMVPPSPQTFEQYTYSQYKYKVTDPKQPLLIVRQKRAGVIETIYLIPEFCHLTGMTDEMRNNFHLMKALDQTKVNPEKKFQEINQFLTTLKSNKEVANYLNSWGLGFDTALKVKGYLLPSPFQEFKPQVIKGIPWALVCLPKEIGDLKRFIDFMKNDHGLPDPVIVSPKGTYTRDYVQCIEQHYKSSAKVPFYFVVISSRDNKFYNVIKQSTILNLSTISQCAKINNLTNPEKVRSIVTNLSFQIAGKLGGPPPWTLKNNTLQGFPCKVMQVGIDVGHNADQKGKSVVGFVASLNDDFSQFHSIPIVQTTAGKEIIHSLKPAMMSALEAYHKFNKFYPELVIVYRDGVGDGMLKDVFDKEVMAIKDAFVSMGSIYSVKDCKLMYTIVKKNTHTRFMSVKDKSNPPPGTLVTQDCTKGPSDFFLISQKPLGKNTTLNPTHYNIIHDTSGILMSEFQKFTYHQTYLYFNTKNSVSVPAICKYAHELAFFVGRNIFRAPQSSLSSNLYFL